MATAALMPLIPALPVPSGEFRVPSFFTDASVQRLSPTGSVLLSPYEGQVTEVCQALSGMAFRTQVRVVYAPGPGGHMEGPDLDALGKELNELDSLGQPAPTSIPASQRATFLGDLRASDVRSIVVGPSGGQNQVAQLFTELLETPGLHTGGVIVWYDVQP